MDEDVQSHHNHPLYVIEKVRDVELKRAVLNQGSSLNLISLSVLNAVSMPLENIMRQPIEVLGFGGSHMYAMRFVNLDQIVGPIRVAHQFYVIDAQTTYQLLLR